MENSKQKRVVGVVRVSEVGDRDAISLHSPDVQADRIREACERDGARLVGIRRELDVSGRKPLEGRPGLLAAVRAVEAREANAVMVAYFDRLVRSLKVQREVVERVEKAGGEVLTLDFGRLSNGTAIQRLTGTLLGAVYEYVAEQSGEKAAEGQRRAVEAGHFIGPAPPGYLRGTDKRLVVDSDVAPIAVEAFDRRAAGASFGEVQAFLAEQGVERTTSGVRKMLKSRAYLGEVNFGDMFNPNAHEQLVDRDTFERCQRMVCTKGRKSKSPRLLARLGILRCATCGGRMSASSGVGGWKFYRCASQACGARQAIGADGVERLVVFGVKRLLEGMSGTAHGADGVVEAERALETAQRQLDAALEAFADLLAEPAAVRRLESLRDARDAARERRDELASHSAAKSIAVTAGDWDRMTLEEQRALIVAVIDRVTVGPGEGDSRVTVSSR